MGKAERVFSVGGSFVDIFGQVRRNIAKFWKIEIFTTATAHS